MFILSQESFSFSCPASKKAGGAQEVGRGDSQGRWPKLATGIFHTMWHHVQYINWGELAWGDGCSRTNWASVSKWWAITLCITCFIYSNPFIIIVILLLSLLVSSFLSYYPYLYPRVLLFPSGSLPHPTEGRGSEWAAAWCLVAGWG